MHYYYQESCLKLRDAMVLCIIFIIGKEYLINCKTVAPIMSILWLVLPARSWGPTMGTMWWRNFQMKSLMLAALGQCGQNMLVLESPEKVPWRTVKWSQLKFTRGQSCLKHLRCRKVLCKCLLLILQQYQSRSSNIHVMGTREQPSCHLFSPRPYHAIVWRFISNMPPSREVLR